MSNFIEDIIESDLSEGKVKSIVTRFPPEPNGYLHIGHVKSICLNYYGTAVKYGGKFKLRFDDTNPAKEDDEFVRSIVDDVKWLGVDTSNVLFASDYFDKMYECAVKLIKKGKAYVDDMNAEEIRLTRGTLTEPGVESKNRNRPIEESLKLFDDMKNGLVADGALILRAKIDMASPNINMRDPIIYRVVHEAHHRQGDKWCIYPMYDFAHPIEDAIEGITHSICTLEFEDHRPLYDWIVRECEFVNPPHQYEFARLSIKRTIMSKRYLKKLVDTGAVDGWDDPRMPTIAGLRRRGYTPSSLRDFCEKIGVSKANSEVETGLLESCIRDELNANAPRAMAVLDPIKLIIVNRDDNFSEELDFEINPTAEGSGTRKITLSNELYIERSDFEVVPPPKFKRLTLDGMVRLKGAYIIKAVGYEMDGDKVTCVKAEIVEGTKSGQDNSGIKVKGVIHWVDAKTSVDVEARMYDYLLLDTEEKMDFSERMNPDSLKVMQAKAEKYLSLAKGGQSFQFLRQGYFCRDIKEEKLVYNLVVSLKDSYKK
ncbi:MAG: glutamine--tRNA ligase/YqeY domain fusion protein [Clostridia bacterium]|nr:glutamine--tRNA ligase/YqeY domain fusion protein [Clostridia bacterium]